jgi:hypothetical protein
MTGEINDMNDVWWRDSSGSMVVRVSVTYREIGAGPETAEILWENAVPLADYLCRVLKVLLDRGGES